MGLGQGPAQLKPPLPPPGGGGGGDALALWWGGGSGGDSWLYKGFRATGPLSAVPADK